MEGHNRNQCECHCGGEFPLNRRRLLKAGAAALVPVFRPGLVRASAGLLQFGGGDPWALLDGRANAPSGTPQFPTLLNGYPTASPPGARVRWPASGTQPPWMVAGVDYAVGIPSGTLLKDPASIPLTGVTFNTSTHVASVTGANVTLDSYDFSLEGGWQVSLSATASNTTIKNCKFKFGTNAAASGFFPMIGSVSGSGAWTIEYCEFDGSSVSIDAHSFPAIDDNADGTKLFQYCDVHDLPTDALDFNNSTVITQVQFNLFHNLGTDASAHPDTVQWVNCTVSAGSFFNFNTVMQDQGIAAAGLQAIQLTAKGSGAVGYTVENNTIIASGPTQSMSACVAQTISASAPINGAAISQNYLDPTGTIVGEPGGSWNGTFTNSATAGNIDMTTGSATHP